MWQEDTEKRRRSRKIEDGRREVGPKQAAENTGEPREKGAAQLLAFFTRTHTHTHRQPLTIFHCYTPKGGLSDVLTSGTVLGWSTVLPLIAGMLCTPSGSWALRQE